MQSDPIWYENVKVLPARYREFFPTRDQSHEERLNAIVRLIGYASLAAFAIHRRVKYLALGVAGIALTTLAHRFGMRARLKNSGGYMNETYANVAPAGVGRGNVRCSRPTDKNPFSNMTVGALITDPTRAPACSYDAPGVADEMRRGFNKGLFKNMEDVYEVENSQRQFYTMPVTTSAPDTIAFAQFLYGSRGKTCKEAPEKCKPWFATRD
jgi:hypothetical protein